MKKEIRDMIRQKQVTGEKVGQIMIRDLVTLYQVQRDAQDLNAQPLTEAEKAQLVAALSTPEEVAVYSQYKFVINYLQQVSLYHSVAWQEVEINFLKLYSALSPLDDNEHLLGVIHRFPPLMEEHEYEQAIAEEQQRRMESLLTGEQLMLGLCLWLCMRPDQPMHHEALRVTNGTFFIVDAPFRFLYHLQLRNPELYQYLLDTLDDIPGFSSNNLLLQFPYREVEAHFPGLYNTLYNTPEGALFPVGYAIPRRGASPCDPMETEGIGVIALLDRLGTQLSQVYQHFLRACRHTLAIEEAVRLLSVRVDVYELADFLQTAQVPDRLKQLTILINRMAHLPQALSPEGTEALDQRVQQLFPESLMNNLLPPESVKETALKAMTDLSILERPSVFHQMLLEEGGVVLAP